MAADIVERATAAPTHPPTALAQSYGEADVRELMRRAATGGWHHQLGPTGTLPEYIDLLLREHAARKRNPEETATNDHGHR